MITAAQLRELADRVLEDGSGALSLWLVQAADTIDALTAELATVTQERDRYWEVDEQERMRIVNAIVSEALRVAVQERDALRTLRDEVWQNPERWMEWCDHRVLEENEKLKAAVAAAKSRDLGEKDERLVLAQHHAFVGGWVAREGAERPSDDAMDDAFETYLAALRGGLGEWVRRREEQ